MDSMDYLLARTLVRDALSTVLPDEDLVQEEHVTLAEIGLSTPAQRDQFKIILVARIEEQGYQIDPVRIPCGPDDTPRIVAQVLPGHVTKGNTI